MDHQPFEWTCPTCKKLVVTWTEKALRDTTEQHEYKHKREIEDFREADKPKPEPGTAIVIFEEIDYNILPLTAIDVGFLKTRGVKVDDEDKPNAAKTTN